MKIYLFLRTVSDFVAMKIHVLGYDDMSTGIVENEDVRSKILWKVDKYLPIDKTSYQRKPESWSRWLRKHLGSKIRLLCIVTPSLGRFSYSSVIIMFILLIFFFGHLQVTTFRFVYINLTLLRRPRFTIIWKYSIYARKVFIWKQNILRTRSVKRNSALSSV